LAEASAEATEARVAAATVVAMAVEATGTSRRPLPGKGAPAPCPPPALCHRHTVRHPLASAVMSRSPGRASPPEAGRVKRAAPDRLSSHGHTDRELSQSGTRSTRARYATHTQPTRQPHTDHARNPHEPARKLSINGVQNRRANGAACGMQINHRPRAPVMEPIRGDRLISIQRSI
jgi:hypothetical protein